MNKLRVVESFISYFEHQISQYREIKADTRRRIIDSPSANQSHSDTSRYQLSNLALGQESRLGEIEQIAFSLRSINVSPQDKVVVGALFTLQTEGVEPRTYFMFPGAQGDILEVDGVPITAISFKSPLGKAALGKRRGECVTHASCRMEITGVW